jgi:hypothetical protein
MTYKKIMERNNGTTKDSFPLYLHIVNLMTLPYNITIANMVTGQDEKAKLGGFTIRSNKSTTSYKAAWFFPTIEISGISTFKNISFFFLNISPDGKFKTKCGE